MLEAWSDRHVENQNHSARLHACNTKPFSLRYQRLLFLGWKTLIPVHKVRTVKVASYLSWSTWSPPFQVMEKKGTPNFVMLVFQRFLQIIHAKISELWSLPIYDKSWHTLYHDQALTYMKSNIISTQNSFTAQSPSSQSFGCSFTAFNPLQNVYLFSLLKRE